MRKGRVPFGSVGRAPLMLATLCPSRQRQWRKYLIRRSDGFIYFNSAWRSIASVMQRRDAARKRARRNRKSDNARKREQYAGQLEQIRKRQRERWQRLNPAQRARRNKRRSDQSKANRVQQNARQREWYKRNRVEQLAKILANRAKRDPAYGLNALIERCRRGEVDFAELDRRINAALTRVAEIDPRRGGKRSDHRKPNKRGV